MRLKLIERIKELEPSLEGWAACFVKSSPFAGYEGRWYKPSDLSRCYCLGKDDTFPCPHCQNLERWKHVHVHPAIVAEMVRWWRTLLVMDNAIKLGDLNSYMDARNRAAYAIYALERHHAYVETYNNEWLVKGKPGLDDSRNAVLRSILMKHDASDPIKPIPYTEPGDWRFAYAPLPPPMAMPKARPPAPDPLPSPDRWAGHPWTPEQIAASVRNDRPSLPPQSQGQRTDLMKAYALHLDKMLVEKMLGLGVVNVNVDGDLLLIEPKDVAEFVALPCKAGYSVHEQTLVVKIAARDLLDRYSMGGGGGVDGSALSSAPDGSEPCPVPDWLGAAYTDPTQARGMCAQFGYSQEPEIQRRGGVGPRRR
jgi:hypothetical protein